jgi:hypothetical protein
MVDLSTVRALDAAMTAPTATPAEVTAHERDRQRAGMAAALDAHSDGMTHAEVFAEPTPEELAAYRDTGTAELLAAMELFPAGRWEHLDVSETTADEVLALAREPLGPIAWPAVIATLRAFGCASHSAGRHALARRLHTQASVSTARLARYAV